MANLVDLDQFRNHLRLSTIAEDDDLQMKLDLAEEFILDWINQRHEDSTTLGDWAAEIAAWTPETVPARVIGAILEQTAEFYRLRGDDPSDTAPKRDPGTPCAGALHCLYRFRDPALA